MNYQQEKNILFSLTVAGNIWKNTDGFNKTSQPTNLKNPPIG